MIAIYKNESFLIEDKVKEYFKEKYKHLELRISIDDINGLVNGYVVTVIDNKLMLSKSVYVSLNDAESYKEIIDRLMDSISISLNTMLFNYYHTA